MGAALGDPWGPLGLHGGLMGGEDTQQRRRFSEGADMVSLLEFTFKDTEERLGLWRE